jgi:hypothetical protein
MSNTLTNLIQDAYVALDVVSRELVGFIPAVTRDASVDRAAVGQNVRSFKTAANTAGKDIAAAMAFPAAAYQTVGNDAITITKARAFPFSWTGEEQYAVNSGPGTLSVAQDQIAQAYRAAVNEIENDIADAAALGASGGITPNATTLFSATLKDATFAKKFLDDRGAPMSDRHMVLNTTAGASMRGLTQLNSVNSAGNETLLRQGVLGDIMGFAVRESAQVGLTAAATGASYLVDNVAGYAVGATTVHVDTGTGSIPTGSLITIGGNTYTVVTGFAGDGDGDVVIAAPGLIKAIANNDPVTVLSAQDANAAFSRNAIVLATRLPAVPIGGDDLAIMREVVTDPRSGLSFELAVYPGYRMLHYEVGILWGPKVLKPEHICLLTD